jgi:ubiquinone/menaquinone biosynthesis C-methylase UbiE
MNDYYSRQLSSNSLKKCYDIAPSRVLQYLQAEVDYVLEHIQPSDIVIEFGCGYGRVMRTLLPHSSILIGTDTSLESLKLALEYVGKSAHCHFFQSDASQLSLHDKTVDKVVCIQNGISAFKVNPMTLIKESVRITREGGCILFSSYSDKVWKNRLDWFVMQSEASLIGEIDWSKTGNGVIVCSDGFKSSTFSQEDFVRLTDQLNLDASVCEIDSSSVFCMIKV